MSKLNEELVAAFLEGKVVIKNTSDALIDKFFTALLVNIEDFALNEPMYGISSGHVYIVQDPKEGVEIVDVADFFTLETAISVKKSNEYVTIDVVQEDVATKIELFIDYDKKSYSLSSEHKEGVSFSKDTLRIGMLKSKGIEAALQYLQNLRDKGEF